MPYKIIPRYGIGAHTIGFPKLAAPRGHALDSAMPHCNRAADDPALPLEARLVDDIVSKRNAKAISFECRASSAPYNDSTGGNCLR